VVAAVPPPPEGGAPATNLVMLVRLVANGAAAGNGDGGGGCGVAVANFFSGVVPAARTAVVAVGGGRIGAGEGDVDVLILGLALEDGVVVVGCVVGPGVVVASGRIVLFVPLAAAGGAVPGSPAGVPGETGAVRTGWGEEVVVSPNDDGVAFAATRPADVVAVVVAMAEDGGGENDVPVFFGCGNGGLLDEVVNAAGIGIAVATKDGSPPVFFPLTTTTVFVPFAPDSDAGWCCCFSFCGCCPFFTTEEGSCCIFCICCCSLAKASFLLAMSLLSRARSRLATRRSCKAGMSTRRGGNDDDVAVVAPTDADATDAAATPSGAEGGGGTRCGSTSPSPSAASPSGSAL
jgi:hypothetical protein